MQNPLSKEFYQYWDENVKPIVLKIVTPEQFLIIGKGNNVSKEEIEILESWVNDGIIEDLNSAYYIGFMAHDIEETRNSTHPSLKLLNLLNSIQLVQKTLSPEGTFYKNVWNDELNTEFRKNVYNLGVIMPNLTSFI